MRESPILTLTRPFRLQQDSLPDLCSGLVPKSQLNTSSHIAHRFTESLWIQREKAKTQARVSEEHPFFIGCPLCGPNQAPVVGNSFPYLIRRVRMAGLGS